MDPDQAWRDCLIRSILGSPVEVLPEGKTEPYPFELYEEDFIDFLRREGFPRGRIIDLGRPGWGRDWEHLGQKLEPEGSGWRLRWYERGWMEPGRYFADREECEETLIREMSAGKRYFGLSRPRPVLVR